MGIEQTLRLLAKARGLTAGEIAAAIPKVGAATVSAWMRGEKAPAAEQMDAFARAVGVPAAALLSTLTSALDPARTRGERTLLAAYRALNTRQQGALLEVARSMTGTRAQAARRAHTPGARR